MIPLHPKRHLVSPRNWTSEPQDHLRTHLGHIARTHGAMTDPHMLQTLLSQEQFNVTARDRVVF